MINISQLFLYQIIMLD